jgi:hypothetical protein
MTHRSWPPARELVTIRAATESVMSIVLANDRRTMRRNVHVDCQVVRERDFKLLGERTLDLSTHGMLVVSVPCTLHAYLGRRAGDDRACRARPPSHRSR